MFTCQITKKEFQGLCRYQQKQIRTIPDKRVCSQCDYYRKVMMGTWKTTAIKQKGPVPTRDVSIFTRFPPHDETIFEIEEDKFDAFVKQSLGQLQAYVTASDIDPMTFSYLHGGKSFFQETKNPIYAIEAFLSAREAGLYPPLWVLDWLAKGFQEYHKSNGRKPIGRLLGFTGRSFKKLMEKNRDAWQMENIWRLKRFCGYDVKTAARMVSEHLKNNPGWNKTGLKLRTPDGPTLASRYSAEGWEHIFDEAGRKQTEAQRFKNAKWRKRYLSLFKKPK